MKRKHILLACLTALSLIVAILLRPQSRQAVPAEPTAPNAEPIAYAEPTPAAIPAVTMPATQPSPPPSSPAQLENTVVEEIPAPSAPAVVRIRRDEVLATVNGVVITLQDLLPVKPGAAEETQALEPDRYEFLVNRAVERELAVQSAKVKGVTLTEAQQQSLAKRGSQSDAAEPGEFDNLGRTAVNGEFEQRDAAGLMLLHNLATAAGVPSPHVTVEEAWNYFTAHQSEFPAIPQDAAKRREVAEAIDAAIRAKLAPALKARYDEQFGRFVEQLKAGAQITVSRPI